MLRIFPQPVGSYGKKHVELHKRRYGIGRNILEYVGILPGVFILLALSTEASGNVTIESWKKGDTRITEEYIQISLKYDSKAKDGIRVHKQVIKDEQKKDTYELVVVQAPTGWGVRLFDLKDDKERNLLSNGHHQVRKGEIANAFIPPLRDHRYSPALPLPGGDGFPELEERRTFKIEGFVIVLWATDINKILDDLGMLEHLQSMTLHVKITNADKGVK